MKDSQNLYTFLRSASERLGMYIGEESLEKLDSYIWGYIAALKTHNINESTPPFEYFYSWVQFTKRIRTVVQGHKGILEACNGDEKKAIKLFFELINEFSNLKSTNIRVIEIPSDQIRSKEYREVNFDWPIPDSIIVYRYSPGETCYYANCLEGVEQYGNSLYPNLKVLYGSLNWEYELGLEIES